MCRDTDKIVGFEVTRVGRRGMLDYRDCFLGGPVALAGVFACLCDVHKLLPFFVSSGSGCRVRVECSGPRGSLMTLVSTQEAC
jgi:hypothetical protein